jgi:hypothetical protein
MSVNWQSPTTLSSSVMLSGRWVCTLRVCFVVVEWFFCVCVWLVCSSGVCLVCVFYVCVWSMLYNYRSNLSSTYRTCACIYFRRTRRSITLGRRSNRRIRWWGTIPFCISREWWGQKLENEHARGVLAHGFGCTDLGLLPREVLLSNNSRAAAMKDAEASLIGFVSVPVLSLRTLLRDEPVIDLINFDCQVCTCVRVYVCMHTCI